MDRPLRVLTVARWYPSHDVRYRGAFVADLVRALGDRGADVIVASWEPALVRGGRPAGAELEAAVEAWAAAVRSPAALTTPRTWGARVPVARLPVVDDAGHDGWHDRVLAHAALLEPFALARHAETPIDLVHAHTGIPDGLAAARLADRLGVPLVVTEHASDAARSVAADPELAGAYRSLLTGPRRLVAISAASQRRLADALGVSPGAIAVIGNVVDTAAFTPADPTGRDPAELLWVGERSPKKGTDVLLRAMALLAADRPGLRLRLVGRAPTPEVEALWTALAAELGIADRVVFGPPADRAGVVAAMAGASVLVHPSPAETFGVVAAEAASSGLPVAATPSGGVEDILGRDGSLGTVAAGHDPADLARAVADVLARRAGFDPDAMHRSIAARFGAPKVAEAYATVYAGLLGLSAAGAAPAPASVASPPSGAAPTPVAGPVLVVGVQRVLLERRLAQLPHPAPPGVTVLTLPGRSAATSAEGASRHLPTRDLPLDEVDPDAPFAREMARLSGPELAGLPAGLARAIRTVLHPLAPGARRRLRERRDELRARELERLVLEAWRARSAEGATAWIVALDPADVLAARAALEAGAPLAPGGLRWLADRLDAAGAWAGAAEAGHKP